MSPRSLLLQGMHGMGDNFHQRAIIRDLMALGYSVYLESSWVSLYWDLIEKGLKVIRKQSHLRTQTKNAVRELDHFYRGRIPDRHHIQKIWYRAQDIRETGSVVGAMYRSVGLPFDPAKVDFSFPVRPEWHLNLRVVPKEILLNRKPLLVYRPLVERTEWGGCPTRNPHHDAYYDLFESVRDGFFVVSVADLVPGREWIVGRRIAADLEYHHGELSFEALVAIVDVAHLTFCSPGFMVPMSQAVSTPVVCVFGGYENSKSFSVGALRSPYLGIDPIKPCECFLHHHNCTKVINIPEAKQRMLAFVEEHASPHVTASVAATA